MLRGKKMGRLSIQRWAKWCKFWTRGRVRAPLCGCKLWGEVPVQWQSCHRVISQKIALWYKCYFLQWPQLISSCNRYLPFTAENGVQYSSRKPYSGNSYPTGESNPSFSRGGLPYSSIPPNFLSQTQPYSSNYTEPSMLSAFGQPQSQEQYSSPPPLFGTAASNEANHFASPPAPPATWEWPPGCALNIYDPLLTLLSLPPPPPPPLPPPPPASPNNANSNTHWVQKFGKFKILYQNSVYSCIFLHTLRGFQVCAPIYIWTIVYKN